MKFAHLADCHVGAWREPSLRELTVQAFERAISVCLAERVDFVLIAGDLFHTAIPGLDGVKAVFKQLSRLKEAGVPVYFITGSHDYSPTGKTMLDIIEEAGLGRNVFRGAVHDGTLRLAWTTDPKTTVKLAGVLGRANQLDTEMYERLDHAAAEAEPGKKIFLFHTALEELNPPGMIIDASPLSLLPKGCTYYAGGHVHARMDAVIEGKHIVYPGPLFPASFSELEELGSGSFCIIEDWRVRRIPLVLRPVVSVRKECTGVAPANVPALILDSIEDVQGAIVLLRLEGTLAGKPSDLPWRGIVDELLARGAYAVLRNTLKLASPEMGKSVVSVGSLAEIEERVLSEHDVDRQLVRSLMDALGHEMVDGEKRGTYEERVLNAARSVIVRSK